MESLAAVAVGALERFDQNLTLAVNSANSRFSDQVWAIFSDKATWYPLYLLIAIFLVWRLGWKRGLLVTFSCALTILACDQLSNLFKDGFDRLRPCWDPYMVNGGLNLLEGRGSMHGFFSAHAANAVGFAVCSWMGLRSDLKQRYNGYIWALAVWAALVGISRIFVGKHFVGDVLVGFCIGLIMAQIVGRLTRYAIVRFKL